MRFSQPWFLLFIVLVAPLVWWELRKKTAAVRFSDLAFFKPQGHNRGALRRLPFALEAAGLVLIGLALARPQQGRVYEEVETSGIDIMLCLDISQTMSINDYQPFNRLYVAKEKAKEFIGKRLGDRIGLVVFAQTALTQCPLTLDHKILTDLIDRMDFGIVPPVQTAIGLGLATSVNRLKDSRAKDKIIILLTDGQNNAGDIDPLTAAKLAQAYQIKVYCVGIGTKGRPDLPESVELDMNTLDRISSITGGKAFLATDAEALKVIYDEIDQMEPTTFKVLKHTVYSEKAGLFLLPAAVSLLLSALLGLTVLRRLP